MRNVFMFKRKNHIIHTATEVNISYTICLWGVPLLMRVSEDYYEDNI